MSLWCPQWLVEYNAALACICFMAFLGFVDDVLDVPWRVYASSQALHASSQPLHDLETEDVLNMSFIILLYHVTCFYMKSC